MDFTGEQLRVYLADGRQVLVPLSWFPRLQNASPSQRSHWELIGGGIGIHWPDVDEDVSVEPAGSARIRPANAESIAVGHG